MNRFNPDKLLNSKWTAANPIKREKHFIVTKVDVDEAGTAISCTIEAVISRRLIVIKWQDLKNPNSWSQGWKQ